MIFIANMHNLCLRTKKFVPKMIYFPSEIFYTKCWFSYCHRVARLSCLSTTFSVITDTVINGRYRPTFFFWAVRYRTGVRYMHIDHWLICLTCLIAQTRSLSCERLVVLSSRWRRYDLCREYSLIDAWMNTAHWARYSTNGLVISCHLSLLLSVRKD